MLKIVKWSLTANYIFWGCFLIVGLCQNLVYNGIENVFHYECVNAQTLDKEIKPNRNYKLNYTYKVKHKVYKNSEGFSKTLFDTLYKEKENPKVCYNKTFNKFSYLEKRNLGIQRARLQILVSGIFLGIFILIGIFANLEKWAKRYESALQ